MVLVDLVIQPVLSLVSVVLVLVLPVVTLPVAVGVINTTIVVVTVVAGSIIVAGVARPIHITAIVVAAVTVGVSVALTFGCRAFVVVEWSFILLIIKRSTSHSIANRTSSWPLNWSPSSGIHANTIASRYSRPVNKTRHWCT